MGFLFDENAEIVINQALPVIGRKWLMNKDIIEQANKRETISDMLAFLIERGTLMESVVLVEREVLMEEVAQIEPPEDLIFDVDSQGRYLFRCYACGKVEYRKRHRYLKRSYCNLECYKSKPNIQSNTRIERKTMLWLHERGISFEPQKEVLNARPDIFIPPNICLYIDGDLWHNSPHQIMKDKRVTERLESAGYKVVRIPEKLVHEKDFSQLAFLLIP